jgi:hypothetical protein
MKSFNIPQPIFHNQNAPKIPQSASETAGVSAIASQLMNMFDPFKLNTSLLNKRPASNIDNAVEEELQKKLKTAALASNFQAPGLNPLAGLLLQQNPLMNPLFGAGLPNKGLPDFFDPMRLQNLQNLNLLLNLNQSKLQENLSALPVVNNKKTEAPAAPKPTKTAAKQKSPSTKLTIKEEYLNQEDVHTSHESPMSVKRALSDHKSTNDTTSDNLEEKVIPTQFTPLMVEEPVLAEYTRMFPEWDLATIFNYLKSEKSMQEFEKDRLQRLEKKMKRRSGPKSQNKGAVASKAKVPAKAKIANTTMNKPIGLLQF